MGRAAGVVLLFICLGAYFLFPLNSLLGIPPTGLFGMEMPGITVSQLFSLCSNPLIGLILQCSTINFIAYAIFILAFIGIVLIIKG